MSAILQLRVCDHMKADVAAVLKAEGMNDVALSSFPSNCGHPAIDWATVVGATAENASLPDIYVIGGICLSDLKPRCHGASCECMLIRKSLCFEYLVGAQMVDWQVRTGAYLLTPGWLEHWRSHIDAMGFSQATGRAFFKESVNKLVLLDTGTLPDSRDKLTQLSAFLDLPAETIPVGLDHLSLELRILVDQWRHKRENRRLALSSNRTARLASDFAMASELLGELVEITGEENVVRKIAEICRSLYAPNRMTCAGIDKDTLTHAETIPVSQPPPLFLEQVANEPDDYGFTRSGTGFWVKLVSRGTIVGWLDADGFAFPEHLKHYLNLALAMSKVFALCLQNARTYARLEEAAGKLRQEVVEREHLTQERENLIGQLQDTLAKIKTLQGLLPICAGCKKIRDDNGKWNSVESYVQARTDARFSHGMCPECIPIWFPEHNK